MTGQEIVNRANQKMLQTSGDKFSDATMLSFVNEGYVDFCRATQILEKTTLKTISSLDSYVELPTDFLESRQVRWSYDRQIFPGSERKLDYNQRDWVFEVGTPEAMVYRNYNTVRLKPISSAAGTVMFRHSYIPSDVTTGSEPSFVGMFHDALANFAVAEALRVSRKYEEADKFWGAYVADREKAKTYARQYQRTPDIFVGQRPTTVFNWPYWDSRFRSHR